MAATFCAAGNNNVAFSIGICEQAGDQIVCLVNGNSFMADRAGSLYARLWRRIAVGASVDGTALVANFHGTVDTAHYVFAGQELAVAERA